LSIYMISHYKTLKKIYGIAKKTPVELHNLG